MEKVCKKITDYAINKMFSFQQPKAAQCDKGKMQSWNLNYVRGYDNLSAISFQTWIWQLLQLLEGGWADFLCAGCRMERSGVKSWPETWCVLGKLSYRIGLWDRYWRQDSFSSLFFVPCNPTSHWKMKLVPGYFPFLKWPNEKALFTVNFSHFHHLTYWIIL